jgi:DnaJ-class molecular chaperone
MDDSKLFNVPVKGDFVIKQNGNIVMEILHDGDKILSKRIIDNSPTYWQVCPLCKGSGIITPQYFAAMNTSCTCDACDGKKIVSTLTGKPPTY